MYHQGFSIFPLGILIVTMFLRIENAVAIGDSSNSKLTYEYLRSNFGTKCKKHEWKCIDDGHCIWRRYICRANETAHIDAAMYDYNEEDYPGIDFVSSPDKLEQYISGHYVYTSNATCNDGKDQDEEFCKSWQADKVCVSQDSEFKCLVADRCINLIARDHNDVSVCEYYVKQQHMTMVVSDQTDMTLKKSPATEYNYNNVHENRQPEVYRCPNGEDQSEEVCRDFECKPHQLKCPKLNSLNQPCARIVDVCNWVREDKTLRSKMVERKCGIVNSTDFCKNVPSFCEPGALRCKEKGTRKENCLPVNGICNGKAECGYDTFRDIVIKHCKNDDGDQVAPPYNCHNYWKMTNVSHRELQSIEEPDEWGEFCNGRIERTCPDSAPFKCTGGKCIPCTLVCDGFRNCPSGEDELDDSCSTAYNECGLRSKFVLTTMWSISLSVMISFAIFFPMRLINYCCKKLLKMNAICEDCNRHLKFTSNWDTVDDFAQILLHSRSITTDMCKTFADIHKNTEQLFALYSYIHMNLDIISYKEQAMSKLDDRHKIVKLLFLLEKAEHETNSDVLTCWKRNLGTNEITRNLLTFINPPDMFDKIAAKIICKGKQAWCKGCNVLSPVKEALGFSKLTFFILEMAKDFQQVQLLWIIYFMRAEKNRTSPYNPLDLPLLIMDTSVIVLAHMVMCIFLYTKEGNLLTVCKHKSRFHINTFYRIVSTMLLPIMPGVLQSLNAINEINTMKAKENMANEPSSSGRKSIYISYLNEKENKIRIRKAYSYLKMIHSNIESAFQVFVLLCIVAREPIFFAIDHGSIYDGVIRLDIFFNTPWLTFIFYFSLICSVCSALLGTVDFVVCQRAMSLKLFPKAVIGVSYTFQFVSCYISMLAMVATSVPIGATGLSFVLMGIIFIVQYTITLVYYRITNTDFTDESPSFQCFHVVANTFTSIPYQEWEDHTQKDQKKSKNPKIQYLVLSTIKLASNLTMMGISILMIQMFLSDNGKRFRWFSIFIGQEIERQVLNICLPLMLGCYVVSVIAMAVYYKWFELWNSASIVL